MSTSSLLSHVCGLFSSRVQNRVGVNAVEGPYFLTFQTLRFENIGSDSYGADFLSDGVVGADTAAVRYHIDDIAVLDTDEEESMGS